ncbi:MAG: AIR synthase related protein, partial [Candidatus Bipolaricaulis sp.]|nr:AIR synthase related protein [Candidatus Bipolaricaulis sp.]
MTDRETRITPLHGAGGELMDELLARLILPRFGKKVSPQSDAAGAARIGLSALDDGATVALPKAGELVITTDSHLVKPIFFPGGDIGRLAAAGTLNDLAMMGARPIVLTLAAVIAEGFPIVDLERILDSFAAALAETDAVVACGDTKVMPAGELDGIVLNTTGLGIAERAVSDAEFGVGDVVIASGTIGDHGMAILAAREEFHLSTELRSDVAVLWPMIERALAVGGIRAMKDPTRGGLAAALNE